MDHFQIYNPPQPTCPPPPEYSTGELFPAPPQQQYSRGELFISPALAEPIKDESSSSYIKGLFAGATFFTFLEISKYLLFGF
jgi:hypothetical protein